LTGNPSSGEREGKESVCPALATRSGMGREKEKKIVLAAKKRPRPCQNNGSFARTTNTVFHTVSQKKKRNHKQHRQQRISLERGGGKEKRGRLGPLKHTPGSAKLPSRISRGRGEEPGHGGRGVLRIALQLPNVKQSRKGNATFLQGKIRVAIPCLLDEHDYRNAKKPSKE